MTKHKKSKTKGNKLGAKQLQHEVFRLFKRSPRKQLNPRQVIQKLKIDNSKDAVQHAIDQLVESGKLLALSDYKYKLKDTNGVESTRSYHEGIVDMTRTGDAYIVVTGLEEDVHVSNKLLNTALNGDRVKIRAWKPRGRRRPEGEVVEVLERATESFLGTIWLYPRYAIVTPDSASVSVNITVDFKDTKGASDGDKVVVKIEEWEHGRTKTPKGKVTTVLGEAGTHDIEMKAILINHGFDLEFSEQVISESEKLPTAITKEEIALRRDMREITTFTIDPDNAKDFDDALSIRYLENGDCEVGVHIADVSHYITPGMALDKEALERSTSVYLVDRVLPMLPEKLSNELCSLRPKEDKLTFSAVFLFNKNGKISERWFGKTIIHSDRRFTYEEVQEILDAGEGEYADELKMLNKLAKKLRKRRFKEGSINFETEEVKFRLDENGVPIEVYVKERRDSHLLIEDFMLLANKAVAIYMDTKGQEQEVPYIYRIHDEPDPERVFELARFAKELGFEMKIDNPSDIAKSYNALAEAAQKSPGLKLLEPLAIRTMAKAEYSTDNIGHYGLGFEFYTHFTSPIRRYSDVLAHRILERNLGSGNFYREDKNKLQEQCKHISMQERKAMDAERESVKYKQVEFIEKHVGEVFTGYVSGIIDRGMFIELKGNRCEGMVPFETMNGYYEVGGGRLSAKNTDTGKVIKMGDEVQVRIVAADLERRRIDMELVEK